MKFQSLLFTILVAAMSFAQAPTITSFSPTQAEVGASVTITGTGFSTTANDNIVYFGGARATVTNATATQLTVTVPNGSTRDFITVTNGGLTAFSRMNFNLFNSGTASISGDYSLGAGVTVSSVATTTSGLHNSNVWPGFDVIVGAADFNNDGWPDVFKAGNGTVAVHRNLLTGTVATIAASNFSAPSNFTVAGDIISIVTGDIDSDGKLDIITGSSTGISILRNTSTSGTISFAAAVNISTATTNVRIADFDLDGKLDIAAVNDGNLNIFKNTTTSSITFNSAVATALSTTGFSGIDIGDLNNDGKIDIVATKSGVINVIVNNSSTNSLSLSNSITINEGSSLVIVDDIDKDGKNDIYFYNRFFKNNYTSGALLSSHFTGFTNSQVNEGGLGISAPDINADGYPEIILGSWWSHVWIQRNAGTGVSASMFSSRFIPSGVGGNGIGVDLNGDQKVDVIVSNHGNSPGNANFRINQNTMTPTSVISVNNSMTTFNKCNNVISSEQSFTVSGAGLQANIVITPPAGFEISTTTGTGFGTTAITLTQTGGTVNSTTIYVRVPAANNTSSSGTLSLTSTGASTVNISLASTFNSNLSAGTASSSPTLCVNSALTSITHTTTGANGIGTATGLPAGVTAAWATNTLTISGTPTASGAFNYTIPLTGACGSANATGTITVTPAMTAGAASSTPTACLNAAITNITHTTTGATGIGSATGLPAGVSATWASNVLTVSGTPTATGTYNYSIPLTGGCGSVNATGTIIVSANNTAGIVSSTPTVCNASAITNITSSTTGATGIGWASGLPGGVNVTFSSNTVTVSGSPRKTYAVGDIYNGGIIAYIFQPNDNGYTPGKVLIVDPSYKLTGPISACLGRWDMESPTAITSSSIGEGMNNTNNLVTAGHTNTGKAIGFANAYSDGTYSDWFIPSKDELYQILINLPTSIFPSDGYRIRSSTEIVGSLSQTHSYQRSGASVVLGASNDGGCANMVIARYDVLPSITSGNQSYSYSIPLTGGCGSVNVTGTITISDTYTWTGTTNTNPSIASNWSPASVPCSGTNIIIPTGLTNYPSYANLTIDASTTLMVQSGAKMDISGVLTNNGTLTIESGATLVQGASSTLAGSGTYNVKQNITGAGSTTPSGRFWYLGSPVSLSSSSVYFGNAANVVKKRDEATNAWITVASGTPENLVVGKGYYTQAMANSTITFTGGVVNNGAITINGLTRTSGQNFEGFNLVSNPYPSYLNWDAVTRTNVDGTMWYRTNDGSNMVFDTYVANAAGGIGTNLGGTSVTKFIPPMQSFWVRVSQGQTSGSLTLGNSMRSHFSSLGGSIAGLKSTNDEPSLFLRMNLLQSGKKDQLIVYVNETATNGFDVLDGEKMMQAGFPQFYTKSGDKKIVINGLNSAKKQQSLPITMELPTTGVHSFIIEDLEISNGLVWLEDKQEEIIQTLEPGTVYEFYAASGMNAERFVLHFQLVDDAVPTNVYNEVNSSANFSGKGANVHAEAAGVVVIKLPASTEGVTDIQIRDAAGRLVYTGSTNTLDTSVQLEQANGIYYVTLNSNSSVEVRKVFIQQ
jgi:hypothetical protein